MTVKGTLLVCMPSASAGKTLALFFTSERLPWKTKPTRSVWVSVELVAGVGLHAVGEAAAHDVGGDAVEDQVAHRIGVVGEPRVPAEGRGLIAQPAVERRPLQGEDVVVVLLEL